MTLTLTLALAAGACSRKPGEPDPRALADRQAALERCRRAFHDIADWKPPADGLAAHVSRECADIYREPACAAAMRSPPADPAAFAATMVRACRDAYCPRLSEPRPGLCTTRELPPPSAMLDGWRELQPRIFALELGVPLEAVAPLFRPVVVPVDRLATLPPVERAPVRVLVKDDGAHGASATLDGIKGKPVRIVVGGDNVALRELARAAKHAMPDAERVVLAVDKQVPYAAVIAVFDAFRKQGFTKLAFDVGATNPDAGSVSP